MKLIVCLIVCILSLGSLPNTVIGVGYGFPFNYHPQQIGPFPQQQQPTVTFFPPVQSQGQQPLSYYYSPQNFNQQRLPLANNNNYQIRGHYTQFEVNPNPPKQQLPQKYTYYAPAPSPSYQMPNIQAVIPPAPSPAFNLPYRPAFAFSPPSQPMVAPVPVSFFTQQVQPLAPPPPPPPPPTMKIEAKTVMTTKFPLVQVQVDSAKNSEPSTVKEPENKQNRTRMPPVGILVVVPGRDDTHHRIFSQQSIFRPNRRQQLLVESQRLVADALKPTPAPAEPVNVPVGDAGVDSPGIICGRFRYLIKEEIFEQYSCCDSKVYHWPTQRCDTNTMTIVKGPSHLLRQPGPEPPKQLVHPVPPEHLAQIASRLNSGSTLAPSKLPVQKISNQPGTFRITCNRHQYFVQESDKNYFGCCDAELYDTRETTCERRKQASSGLK